MNEYPDFVLTGDRTRVVMPIIDIVSADTFKYESSPLVRGGFNWGLNFKWDPITRSGEGVFRSISHECDHKLIPAKRPLFVSFQA